MSTTLTRKQGSPRNGQVRCEAPVLARNQRRRAIRLLVFPGGTEIGLELRKALAWHEEIELFSAGSEVPNHAPFVFQHHYCVPSVHQSGWLQSLNRLLDQLAIDYIFPAHDDVVLALAENLPKLNCPVITSPVNTCRIARSKSATYTHLAGTVPVPVVYPNPAAVDRFPVVLKPDVGQGSQNVHLSRNPDDLRRALTDIAGRIVVEYLPGEEYTVDCFSDRQRGLLYCSGRLRQRIRSGISMNSEAVRLPEFHSFARRIASRLPFHGAWFFQVKRDRVGRLKLLEIAPRIAGTSALSRAMGVNLPLLSVYEAERRPLSIPPLREGLKLDRALVNRYQPHFNFRTLYVDYEGTLVVRGLVNPQLVALLFQALNQGARLVLLSRSNGRMEKELRAHRLDGIFDEVVQLAPQQPKSSVVRDRAGVLVDGSSSEREEVQARTGVPVFDVSTLEVLLDERV